MRLRNLSQFWVVAGLIFVFFAALVVARKRQPSGTIPLQKLAATGSNWVKGVWVPISPTTMDDQLLETIKESVAWKELSVAQQEAFKVSLESMIRAYGSTSFEDWREFCVGGGAASFLSDTAKLYFDSDELAANRWANRNEEDQMRLYFNKLLKNGTNRWSAISLAGLELHKREFATPKLFFACDEERRLEGEAASFFTSPSYKILHSKVIEDAASGDPHPVEGLILGMIVEKMPEKIVHAIGVRWLWSEAQKKWFPESLVQSITENTNYQIPF